VHSRYVELDGPTHVADFGGDGPPVVLVHGLGGAHVNWLAVGARLAGGHRVLAPDLIGHGRTPVAGRAPTAHGHRRLLHRLLTEVVGEPAVLVGNSMGGLVSLLQAAEAPETVSRLVLVGPAVPAPRTVMPDSEVVRNFLLYLVPGIGERYLERLNRTLTPQQRVELTLDLCTVDLQRVPEWVRRRSEELSVERRSMPWATEAFLQSARSLLPMQLRRTEIDRAVRAVRAPTLVIQGEQDRLVRLASARRLIRQRPDWDLEVLDDCGHVPQLEHPDRFLDVLEGWLAALGASTDRAA